MICPCKDCRKRKLHCHNDCTKYIEWTEENEKVKAERFKQMQIQDALKTNEMNRDKRLLQNSKMRHGKFRY